MQTCSFLLGGSQLTLELGHFRLQLPDPLQRRDLSTDIALDADEIGEVIRLVAYRRDGEFVPERRAILAEVAQHFAAGLATAYCFADSRQPWLLPLSSLEEPAIAVENVIHGIAGQVLEGAICVDEDAVITLLLSHHDTVVGGFDHQLQQLGVDHRGVPVRFLIICLG